jgi:outer membrane protein assembly factor BamB
VGDIVFFASCNGILHGLDRHTGQERQLGMGVMTDVGRGGDNIFVVTLDDELTALDLQTGAVRWTFPSGVPNMRFFGSSTPAVLGDRVVLGTLDGTVYALNATTGDVLWHRDVGDRISTSVAVVGQDIYVGEADGAVYRLDVQTGEEEAQLRISGMPMFGIVPVDDSLLLLERQAGIVMLISLNADLSGVRWSQSGSESGWTSLAWPHVWSGLVFVGTKPGAF